MQTPILEFWHRGQLRQLPNISPTRTLLQVIREDLQLRGTKEGCNEGDCGACVVALREADSAEYKAVNSCIRLAHSIAGMQLTTVEDLACGDQLHPAQEAVVQCHGSQCGFCTPGFVMSLFALHENAQASGQTVDRPAAQIALSGNLCRCTGYRPLLDAAVQMQELPRLLLNKEQTMLISSGHTAKTIVDSASKRPSSDYFLPRDLQQLLALRHEYRSAQLVAGGTDVALWINKGLQQFAQVLDVSRVHELRQVERYAHHVAIGAAVSLHDAFAVLEQDRPQLRTFFQRFAGLPVRNSGTLAGNVANGSPIGDSMPLLIALRANVVLMSLRGHREMPVEALYTGYRKNVIAADEVLAWIKVPLPAPNEFSRVYKISKRYDDDISAVCLAISALRSGDALSALSIGVGGVAATPVRAIDSEALGTGLTRSSALFDSLQRSLQAEFKPISDMRASSQYRQQALGALVQRFASEWHGDALVSLESWPALHEVLA